MELQMILLFLISLMLTIVSAWSLSTFMRLDKASTKYKNNKVFEAACQMSKEYVKTGLLMGSVITILSLAVVAIASYGVYKSF